MSRAFASTAPEEFELDCMRVLASQEGICITGEDANESREAIDQLVNTILRSKSPIAEQNILQVISILEHKKESLPKESHTTLSSFISYILLHSGNEAGQRAGLHLLLDHFEGTEKSSVHFQSSLQTNAGRSYSLQHKLIIALYRLFVDGNRELRFRILAGKLLAEVLLECKNGAFAPKLRHAAFAGIVPMLSRKTDVLLRFFASVIIQILTKRGIAIWSPDKTRHRNIFFKSFNNLTRDPVQSFHAYANEIEHYLSGTLGLWLEGDAVPLSTCFLLDSLLIDANILAKGSILVTQGYDHLRLIHTVEHASSQSFRYIEVPLECIRWTRCSADRDGKQATRLDLSYENSKSILIDGKVQYLDEVILTLVSRNDLTALNSEIQKVHNTCNLPRSDSFTRKPSSVVLCLDTARNVGHNQECHAQGPEATVSENSIGLMEHVDYLDTRNVLEGGYWPSSASRANEIGYTERLNSFPHDTCKSVHSMPSEKASDLFTRTTRAPLSRMMFHLQQTEKEFHTPSSGAAADWADGFRSDNDTHKEDTWGSESSYMIFSPSNPRKRAFCPATSPRKNKRLAERTASINPDEGECSEKLEGRGQQIGKKLADAFLQAELPQKMERDVPPASAIELPESELFNLDMDLHEMKYQSNAEGFAEPCDKESELLIQSEFSQIDRPKDKSLCDEVNSSLKSTIVDSNGSPRLVSRVRSQVIAQSESQPATKESRRLRHSQMNTRIKDFGYESGYDASNEELTGGTPESEGDFVRPTPGTKSVVDFDWTPILDAKTVEAGYDSRIPKWPYYSEVEGPVFSSRCPSIEVPETQHDEKNLEMDPAKPRSPPSFLSCLRKPEDCSCISHSSSRPKSDNEPGATDTSSEQRATGTELVVQSVELADDCDGKSLATSSDNTGRQTPNIREAKALLDLQESAKKISMKSKRYLARQLENEREIAGQVLEQYRRDCNDVLDQLLEGQKERIRVCEEQMETIQKQHKDTCEALIDRLRNDELHIRKRTSLYVTQSLERRGRKRRRVVSIGRRTSSGDISIGAAGPGRARQAHES